MTPEGIKTHHDYQLVHFHRKYLRDNFQACVDKLYEQYLSELKCNADYEEDELGRFLFYGERNVRNTFVGIFDNVIMLEQLKKLLLNHQKTISVPSQNSEDSIITIEKPSKLILDLKPLFAEGVVEKYESCNDEDVSVDSESDDYKSEDSGNESDGCAPNDSASSILYEGLRTKASRGLV